MRLAIRDASRALQAGNAALFMAAFDRRSFAGFQALRGQVTALTAQRRIASSVECGPPEGGPDVWTVRVNWVLDLTPKLDPGKLERRHETLVISMVKRGPRWKIANLEPAGFFSSLHSAPP